MPSDGMTMRVGRASPVSVGTRVGSDVVPGVGLDPGSGLNVSVGGVQIGNDGVGCPLASGLGVAHGGGVMSKAGSPGSVVGVAWLTAPADCGGAQLKTPALSRTTLAAINSAGSARLAN